MEYKWDYLSIYLTVQFIKDKFKSSDNFFNGARYHNNPISRPREKLLVTWELDPRPGLGLELSDGGASFTDDGASRRIRYQKPNVRWLLRRVLKKQSQKKIAIKSNQIRFTMLELNILKLRSGSDRGDTRFRRLWGSVVGQLFRGGVWLGGLHCSLETER